VSTYAHRAHIHHAETLQMVRRHGRVIGWLYGQRRVIVLLGLTLPLVTLATWLLPFLGLAYAGVALLATIERPHPTFKPSLRWHRKSLRP
jgi:hypothetical protein